MSSTTDNNRLPVTAYILLAFTNLFWSLNFIIGKLVAGAIPPATISFFRWLFPAIFFLCLNWKQVKQDWPLVQQHIPLIGLIGLTGYALNSVSVYEAVSYTTTINTAFINAFNPVLIAFAGYLMYRYPAHPAPSSRLFPVADRCCYYNFQRSAAKYPGLADQHRGSVHGWQYLFLGGSHYFVQKEGP